MTERVDTRETRPADAGEERPAVAGQRRGLIMLGVLLGMLLSSIDQTIVGTAMPRIIAELNGLDHYAWVATAYLLTSTVSVPLFGKVSDLYGRRPFFLFGMIVFLIGSALAGFSQTFAQLILFRALQGIGAGAMMPVAMAIVGDVFSPRERGKWQGLLGAVFGTASIMGPAVGGWITDVWGWRWTFYVNMPLGAVALIIVAVALPGRSTHHQHQVDYLGGAALIATAAPLLLAVSWAGAHYPSAQVLGLLAFSAVMGGITVLIESRAAEPMISPRLFTNPIFTISVMATLLTTASMFGGILYLPLFVQGVLGQTATNSGAVITPMMLSFIVGSIAGGQIMARTGRYKLLALSGFAVALVGMILLARLTVGSSMAEVIRGMVAAGLGIGVCISLFTIVVQNAFPYSQLGAVTAGLTFFRSIGGAIGVAVLGAVMTTRFHAALALNLPASATNALPPRLLAALSNPQNMLDHVASARARQSVGALNAQGQLMAARLTTAVHVSLAQAITSVFALGVGAMTLALVATLFLREIPLRDQRPSRDHATAAPSVLDDQGARITA